MVLAPPSARWLLSWPLAPVLPIECPTGLPRNGYRSIVNRTTEISPSPPVDTFGRFGVVSGFRTNRRKEKSPWLQSCP